MKALDIMEAAGGIDDEILMEVTSAMQEKNTGKPLRAKRTLRTVLIAAALTAIYIPCRSFAVSERGTKAYGGEVLVPGAVLLVALCARYWNEEEEK